MFESEVSFKRNVRCFYAKTNFLHLHPCVGKMNLLKEISIQKSFLSVYPRHNLKIELAAVNKVRCFFISIGVFGCGR